MVQNNHVQGVQSNGMTKCPICSSRIPAGVPKCDTCGANLQINTQPSPVSEAQTSSAQTKGSPRVTHRAPIPKSRTAHTQPTSQSSQPLPTSLSPHTKKPSTPSVESGSEPVKTEAIKKIPKKKREGYWSKLDRSEIRRIKIYIYSVEIVLLIVIMLNAMYDSIIIDSDKVYLSLGFYFPLGYLLLMILFLVFLISVEGLWFKYIEIKNARSFDKRSRLIKNYNGTAQRVLVTAVVLVIILLSLSFLPFITEMLKSKNEFEFSPDEWKEKEFEEQDALGLTHTSSIEFDSNETVLLILDTQELNRELENLKIDYGDIGNHTTKSVPLTSPDFQLGYSPNKMYYFKFQNIGNSSISGQYIINREISKPFIFNILLFMILFIITSAIWLAYLGVIRKKYEQLHEKKVAELAKRYAVKPFAIEDVFLIHKDGTLISHQTRRLKPMDNDILSAMLTAIKDFIKDAFKSDSKGELNELKYGKLDILIEHSQFAFLAVVVSGSPPKDLRRRMKLLISQINRTFYNELKSFSGIPKKFESVKGLILQQLLSAEEEGTRFDEGSDSFWNNKGVVQTKLGKYNEAIDCFDKALKVNPGISNIWLNRGIALVKLNEFEEAMDCFDRALQLNPNNEPAKRRRNKCWYKWKTLESREHIVLGSGRHRHSSMTDDYYDYSAPQPAPRMDYAGGGAAGPEAGLGGGAGTGYYDEGGYDAAPVSEPEPRCPKCNQPLRYVDEYESWYCDPCDIYPFDD
jgi:tetratricopeptide (TPR) repeat protein